MTKKNVCTVPIPSVSAWELQADLETQGQGYRPRGSVSTILRYTANASNNIVPY